MTATHLMMVLSSAAPGRRAELEAWYDDHVHRVAAVAGFGSSRRYAPVADRGDPCEHDFVTVYEIETDDLDAAIASLAEARASMPAGVDFARPPTVWFLRACAARPDRDGSP